MAVSVPHDITWVKVSSNSTNPIVIVAAASGYRVVLVGAVLVATTAVTLTVEDSDGTDLTGPMPLGANGGFVLPTTPLGYQMTASGKGLSLLLGGAVQVAGVVGYVVQPG